MGIHPFAIDPLLCGYPARLRFIEQPDAVPVTRAEKRHPEILERRLLAQVGAARYFNVSERTLRVWVDKGFIVGYLKGSALWVDIDEIEAKFKTNRSMRDGRRSRFAPTAVLRPLPLQSDTGVQS